MSPSVDMPSARKLLFPKESGAWGVLLETLLTGLLATSFAAGASWMAEALVALFLLRQPLRRLAMGEFASFPAGYRTRLLVAAAITGGPALACLFVVYRLNGIGPLEPLAVMVIFGGWQFRADLRHQGRELVPQFCGTLGMTSGVAMIVLAGGGSWRLAGALWGLLLLRQWLTIPLIRGIIRHQKGRRGFLKEVLSIHITVGILATIAAMVWPQWWVVTGAILLLVLRAMWRVWRSYAPIQAAAIGIREMVIGVLYAAAIGIHVATFIK